jgi:hypothetical protein
MARRKSKTTSDVKVLEYAIEIAIKPGDFIGHNEGWSFVSNLEKVKEQIDAVANENPLQAAELIETFIAVCYEKAEEIDDSSGSFGMFVEELFCSWVDARQKADFDPKKTIARLLSWMDDDDYGFAYQLERRVSGVLSPQGLNEFAAAIRLRFDAEGEKDYPHQQWGETLKTIYAAGCDLKSYIFICEQTELLPRDCEIIAGLLLSHGKPAEALAWVEKGLKIQEDKRMYRGSSYNLENVKRDILTKLGRSEEALEDAWQNFLNRPHEFSHKELIKYIPKRQRIEWHPRILEVINTASLDSAIALLLKLQEKEQLAQRLRKASGESIESLSHYTIEPAAEKLAGDYPDVAAKLYQAMGLRIVNAGKSKYYGAAISNFEQAKQYYEKAGLEPVWLETVENVMNNHARKYNFMPGFKRVVEGKGPSTEPSFIERAKTRWEK